MRRTRRPARCGKVDAGRRGDRVGAKQRPAPFREPSRVENGPPAGGRGDDARRAAAVRVLPASTGTRLLGGGRRGATRALRRPGHARLLRSAAPPGIVPLFRSSSFRRTLRSCRGPARVCFPCVVREGVCWCHLVQCCMCRVRGEFSSTPAIAGSGCAFKVFSLRLSPRSYVQ